MERFFYEAVLTPNELGGYDARFPDFDIVTLGDDFADAAFMAQDLLATFISSKLADGESVAEVGTFDIECPEDGTIIGIAVYADASKMLDETMSVAEAADILDVSDARIRAMIRDGVLKSTKVGNVHMVDAESVMKRFNEPVHIGRPKKVVSLNQAPHAAQA